MADGSRDPIDHDDIMLTISISYGDLDRPLVEWIRNGPGRWRPYTRPTRAWSRVTGEELPLTVIPVQYRNTRAVRRAIREGRLPNPWPDTWLLPSQEDEDPPYEHWRPRYDPYQDEL
jgi:hypothetical protein